MKNLFKRNLRSVNGLLALIFGLVALFFPNITLAALGVYFAISILVGGIALIVSSVKESKFNNHWYMLLIEGIIGILIAVIILSRPELVATVFVTIMGLWAIFIGLIFLFAYFRSALSVFSNSFLLIISVLSLIVGVLIIINPFESTRLITILIGIYAIIYGIFSMVNSSKSW